MTYLHFAIVAVLSTAATLVVTRTLSRWLPKPPNGQTSEELLRAYRPVIRAANAPIALGFVAALAMYAFLGFSKHDPRPLGLAAGMFAAPMIVLYLAPMWTGKDAAEAVSAYALYQELPVPVLYALACLGAILMAAAFVLAN